MFLISQTHASIVANLSLILSCICVSPSDEVVITVGPSSGTPIHVIPDIESPQQVAIGRNGEIAVSCFQGHKVLVYDCKFEPVTEIGCQGFIDGQFLCPSGVAIDSENQIVVSSYHKLQRFTIDGKFVDAVGEHGKGELQFDCPTNIAIGQEGRLYVSESNNKRVQILNDDLSFHGTFSKACSKLGSGRLNQPQGSAVNSEGKVYVADMMNHAIQVFSPEGEFLFKFGKYGIPNTPGITCTPMAIAIDPLDYVYVGGSGGGISIFDKEGDFVRSFGSYGSEHGQFNMIKGMHIDRCGNLYVCEWSVNRVQIFPGPQSLRHRGDATQQPIDSSEVRAKPKSRKPAYAIGPKSKMPIKVLPDISQPLKMVAGTQGEIVLAVFGDRKVMILDKNFEVIREFNRENEKQGRFVYPAGIAVDESNSILLSTSHYLHRFTMSGDLLASIDGGKGQHGDNVLELDHPQGIAVGKNGRIYVADKRCKRVHIINDDFSLFGFAQNPELTKKSKDSPEDVAISSEGRVYVIDSGIYCVLVFAPDGEFLFKFGKQGAPNIRGALTSPHAITLDDEDNVYIGDAVGIIHIFDKNGGFIRQFGGNGEEPGQFSFISGLHFDKNTHLLYVCEWSNDRVQIFECQ